MLLLPMHVPCVVGQHLPAAHEPVRLRRQHGRRQLPVPGPRRLDGLLRPQAGARRPLPHGLRYARLPGTVNTLPGGPAGLHKAR
jgi:hypothetical protein